MRTIVETVLFQKQWPLYWTEEEGAREDLVLLTLYAKSTTDNLTAAVLKEIRRALED